MVVHMFPDWLLKHGIAPELLLNNSINPFTLSSMVSCKFQTDKVKLNRDSGFFSQRNIYVE